MALFFNIRSNFSKRIFMPKSRKRHGHRYQKPAAIPASQRTKGRIIWAILFAVFGFVITFFATNNYIILIIGAAVGGLIGYAVGKNMEQAASE
jgi:LPS O-antigen subunit length determinant protein (WzzB/FepE family)